MKNKILITLTGLNMASFLILASAYDSFTSVKPLIIMAINAAYLILFAKANNLFYKENVNENHKNHVRNLHCGGKHHGSRKSRRSA